MKHVQKFLVAALALAAIGCGGTGGGSRQPVSSVLNSAPRVECIIAIQPTNLMHPSEWTPQQLADPTNLAVKADLIDPTIFGPQDPTNIETSEQMLFQLVYYTSNTSGTTTRNIISSGVSFTTSDLSSTFGILAGNTGQFTAGSSVTSTPLFVTASYNGTAYSTEYDIRVRQVRMLSVVLDATSNLPLLAGSQVQFYNASNTLVDTVTVQFDGSIRASVPTNTVAFTVFGDSLPSNYYHFFDYNALSYDASVVSCFAPVPSNLPVGTVTLPGSIYVVPRVTGQSTPQATGCTEPQSVKRR